MASWISNPSWTPKENINGGQSFASMDDISADDFNKIVENMQYLYNEGGDFDVSNYPIGSIFMSTNSTSPASIFGGGWERIQDRFLLGSSSIYPAGTTGGEATHVLTVEELPPHKHFFSISSDSTPAGFGGGVVVSSNLYDYDAYTELTGSGQSVNNMPPYLAVYMWKRVS